LWQCEEISLTRAGAPFTLWSTRIELNAAASFPDAGGNHAPMEIGTSVLRLLIGFRWRRVRRLRGGGPREVCFSLSIPWDRRRPRPVDAF
jgi:hypothetical protein